jgi:hypothetical protein
MTLRIRKFVSYSEEILYEGGRQADGDPLVKAVAAAVIANPGAGQFQEDLSVNFVLGGELAETLTERALAQLGNGTPAESYGKAAVVGEAGDQEQAVSFLTSDFGNALREQTEGQEWVCSVTKRGAPGTSIDIPLASKDFLRARSHYDAVTVSIGDAPRADELVVIVALASRSRLNERSGGLKVADRKAPS